MDGRGHSVNSSLCEIRYTREKMPGIPASARKSALSIPSTFSAKRQMRPARTNLAANQSTSKSRHYSGLPHWRAGFFNDF